LDLQSIAESFVREAGIQLVILPPSPRFSSSVDSKEG
jgi:hypothetical protein